MEEHSELVKLYNNAKYYFDHGMPEEYGKTMREIYLYLISEHELRTKKKE